MRLFLLILLLAPALLNAAEYGHVQVERVISVYDADTFRVDIADWPDIVGKNISVRVRGIDAAEIRGKCAAEKALAQQAKLFTQQQLNNAQQIELRNLQRGKYFRLIADVWVDNRNLAELLLGAGLARRYDGGTRQPWCPIEQP